MNENENENKIPNENIVQNIPSPNPNQDDDNENNKNNENDSLILNNSDNQSTQTNIYDDFSQSININTPDVSDKPNFNNDNNNNDNNFQWKFDKYENSRQASNQQSTKNKGPIVFASILGAVILIPLIVWGGLKLPKLISSSFIKLHIPIDLASHEKLEPSESENNYNLDINNNNSKSYNNNLSSVEYPATKIAQKVIPTIVSVVPYARVQSFYQTGITEIGSASGIIMTSDGYIITNAHVVLKLPYAQPVDAIKVILSNDKEYEAKIIGIDINTDLAVIKIDANNLPVAEFGDSDLLKVGEPIFAIGSPLDVEFAGSMTSGIVSALNRSPTSSSNQTVLYLGNDNKYIQTDAAINPGNSGGALVNLQGQVVGINARKKSDIDIEGMGFAIPITQSKPILNDLMNYGHVKGRVKLGITVEKEIDEIISRLNNVKTGILIGSIDETSDLATKDIRQYDILHEIDNTKIYSLQDLKIILNKHKPGDKVHLVFYRYDSFGDHEQKIEVDVTLMEDQGIKLN